jgi:hypothetical protein
VYFNEEKQNEENFVDFIILLNTFLKLKRRIKKKLNGKKKLFLLLSFLLVGPGGRSLIEIQHISGANIQISKKGIFAPGTRNRIVTITGPAHAINTAHFLIEQRIHEEEAKRACQTKVTNATTTAGVLQ